MTDREIKFRAWNSNLQVMEDDVHVLDRFAEILSRNHYTVLRYTGLKDKNGKEIYEGDILNGRNQVLKIVYWCPKRAAFCESEQFRPVPAKHSFAKLYDKFRTVFNKDGQLINHEVIGNIYENPDLMK